MRVTRFVVDNTRKAKKILDILEKEIPDARIALNFTTPLELLIATILSAQATDERVNQTTPQLFKRYKTARDYAEARPQELEGYIRAINFYKNKAKNIIACCKRIVEGFDGNIPKTLDELVTLPGVGRKTANIVLGSTFGQPAIAVDTHVKRVSQRLGLTKSDDPDKIEEDLCNIIPQNRWTKATNLLILHGRHTCKAKGPLCDTCKVRSLCDYYTTSR
ncbi:MAG: endonuclease III [Deltaproteobacteria bacterium]|nr:endonuclease III [Deltaproteobacteria bacterium]